MEIQIQELIDQIKKDGVSVAEKEAAAIINSANEQAQRIISSAQAQSEKIILDAKNDNERMIKSSEDAIRQAGRNLLLSFRESVLRELEVIINETVTGVYSSERLSEIIINVVETWADKPETESIEVILNSETLTELEQNILAGIKARLTNGVTLKANDNFNGGFRISVNNDCVYYDYSTEAVVDMLSSYLNPKVAELLKEA